MRSELKGVARTLVTCAALVASVFASTVSNAHAWGPEGHQVIALIAQSQLTPKTRAEVDRLLAQEPGDTLASISTWADDCLSKATPPR